jgi:enterochelin esterase-like enzyme
MTKKQEKQARVRAVHRFSKQYMLMVLWFLETIVLTGLAGAVLFLPGATVGLISMLIDVGLDPLRAQFITALCVTAGSALVGATFGKRKTAAIIGGGGVLWFGFLHGFIQAQLQPVFDPGGFVEPLNSGNLVRNSLIIFSLGILSAFVGAAIGAAIGETLVDPIAYVFSRLWQSWTYEHFWREDTALQIKTRTIRLSQMRGRLLLRWSAVFGMIVVALLAANSRDLFIISPSVDIHTPPIFRDQNGNAINGTLIVDSMISEALGHQVRPFLVYLPPSYNAPRGRRKHYPVLYLLHGTPGKDLDWISGGRATESADVLIATKKIPELIMVFPDGNGELEGSSEWGNSYDQRQMMETFVASELVRYVDKHYRTIADTAHRAIGGLSMGGFGAMNIAIHHPDVFGSVISLGGYYKAEGDIWGKNETYRQINSPIDTIGYSQQAWQLQMFLGAATMDQPYYTDTLQFVHEIAKLHIHYRLDTERGYHSWPVWQKQIYHALQWLRWERVNSARKGHGGTSRAVYTFCGFCGPG